MIWCFKLITVIVDICMCIVSEGNLNQNKNKSFIIFLKNFSFLFIIGRHSKSHKIVIMTFKKISF